MSLLERCPHFRGWYVQASLELEPEDVSLLERCPHFRGWYVQASLELEPVPIREVSSFQRVASMELEPEDVSLLEIFLCHYVVMVVFKVSILNAV